MQLERRRLPSRYGWEAERAQSIFVSPILSYHWHAADDAVGLEPTTRDAQEDAIGGAVGGIAQRHRHPRVCVGLRRVEEAKLGAIKDDPVGSGQDHCCRRRL